MSYVFDTNAFSQLFHSYYRNRFPTLWEQFDELIEDGEITSTREVSREIEGTGLPPCAIGLRSNVTCFLHQMRRRQVSWGRFLRCRIFYR